MKLPDLDNLPKDRRDWLEVFGNQWGTKKQMPGTCEACVWGTDEHSLACVAPALVTTGWASGPVLQPGDTWTAGPFADGRMLHGTVPDAPIYHLDV